MRANYHIRKRSLQFVEVGTTKDQEKDKGLYHILQ